MTTRYFWHYWIHLTVTARGRLSIKTTTGCERWHRKRLDQYGKEQFNIHNSVNHTHFITQKIELFFSDSTWSTKCFFHGCVFSDWGGSGSAVTITLARNGFDFSQSFKRTAVTSSSWIGLPVLLDFKGTRTWWWNHLLNIPVSFFKITFFFSLWNLLFFYHPSSVRPLNWTEHFSISTSRDCSSSFPSLRSHKWRRFARIQCGWEDGDSSNRHFRVLQCGAGGSVLSGQGRSGYFKQNLSNAS